MTQSDIRVCVWYLNMENWQNGYHFADPIFKQKNIFCILVKIILGMLWCMGSKKAILHPKFHCSLFLRVQLTINLHWFRWGIHAEQCSKLLPEPMMTHFTDTSCIKRGLNYKDNLMLPQGIQPMEAQLSNESCVPIGWKPCDNNAGFNELIIWSWCTKVVSHKLSESLLLNPSSSPPQVNSLGLNTGQLIRFSKLAGTSGPISQECLCGTEYTVLYTHRW